MSAQPSLFDPQNIPTAPASIPEPERKRLSTQCNLMLAALRRGPVSNDALSHISRKYTSRISDIRKAGYDVRIKSQNRKTGLVVYELSDERVQAEAWGRTIGEMDQRSEAALRGTGWPA